MNWTAGARPQYQQSKNHDLSGLPKPVNVAANDPSLKPGVSEEGEDPYVPVRDDGAAAAFARLTQNK